MSSQILTNYNVDDGVNRFQTSNPAGLEDILKNLGPELALLEENIIRDIQTDVELLNTVSQHILLAGGKRLRPALVLLASSLFQPIEESSLRAAQVVEYLHTATLLHDDVVDGAETRRAQKAARQIWGNEASILSGDFLLSKAFHMLTTLSNLEVLKIMSRTTTLMAEGEILQLTREVGSEDEEMYLRIIYLKTACLFSSAAQTGAVLAGAPDEMSEVLKRYGEALGMAFQIVDDALDYVESPQTGKNHGTDLRERKMTLPLIHLIRQASSEDKKFLLDLIKEKKIGVEQVKKVTQMISNFNCIEYSLKRAGDYVDSALAVTERMPDCHARDSLRQLATYVLSRSH